MPEDVRKAYDEVLATLRDADADGIPDVLEAGNARTVIGVQQSSVTFNGRTLTSAGELPAWLRCLCHVCIGGGREHLKGRVAVAIVALLLLGWFDTQATRLARRRQPLLGPDTPGYRRFQLWSGLGLLLTAVLLLGLGFVPALEESDSFEAMGRSAYREKRSLCDA
jgi:hypothetical protein